MFTEFIIYFFKYLWYVNHVLIGLLIIVTLCALVISRVEDMTFGNSLYFSFITAFTIGYGDITPHTNIGKITSIIAGLTGVIFAGIVVATSVKALSQVLEAKNKQ